MKSRLILLAILLPSFSICEAESLEEQLSRLFVGRSFTIRSFYRGSHLRYGSDGNLLEKTDAGYWSRDGMVQFSSVKLSKQGVLIMQGNRYCIQFEPEHGEFVNVRTGDKVEIEIQLKADQLTMQAVIPVLQAVLLSSRDRLADLAPPYLRNCLLRTVARSDKRSLWECDPTEQGSVPAFKGKDIVWDLPPADTSLHTGRRRYLLQHRIAYVSGSGVQTPTVLNGADPYFDWLQERINVGEMTLVLSFKVGEDGKARDILIVSPIGMGVDDEAAQAVSGWKFKPATYAGTPCPVQARVYFDIRPTNSRPF